MLGEFHTLLGMELPQTGASAKMLTTDKVFTMEGTYLGVKVGSNNMYKLRWLILKTVYRLVIHHREIP